MTKYYSQHGQDRYVHETFFKDFHRGTFIEFGALDGLLDSNTLFFERELDWTGILIEPNPLAFAMLEKNRPHCRVEQVAISNENKTMPFMRIDGGFYGWSGLLEDIEPQHWERIEIHISKEEIQTIDVRARDLSWLADKYNLNHVDFMSIDTEGTEEKIINAFPWKKLTVSVFCIENNFQNYSIDALMATHGYEKRARIGPDDIYCRIGIAGRHCQPTL